MKAVSKCEEPAFCRFSFCYIAPGYIHTGLFSTANALVFWGLKSFGRFGVKPATFLAYLGYQRHETILTAVSCILSCDVETHSPKCRAVRCLPRHARHRNASRKRVSFYESLVLAMINSSRSCCTCRPGRLLGKSDAYPDDPHHPISSAHFVQTYLFSDGSHFSAVRTILVDFHERVSFSPQKNRKRAD